MEDIEKKIKSFIEENFLIEFGTEINTSTDLFKAGVIDSCGYVQLISFIQTEFDISYSDEEFLTNIMVSCKAMVGAIHTKQQAAQNYKRNM